MKSMKTQLQMIWIIYIADDVFVFLQADVHKDPAEVVVFFHLASVELPAKGTFHSQVPCIA